MGRLIISFLFLLFTSNYVLGQDKGYLGGFQFKPMLLSDYFNGGTLVQNLDSVNISTNSSFGYVFGMTIRKKFNKSLAIESGLRFVQRNYSNKIDSTFGNYSGNLKYRIIGYEIPFKALVTMRASTNSFFSVAFGAQLDFYPSDVYSNDNEWLIETNRRSWLQGSFLANVGWEVNPNELGTFYFGLSYTQPFKDPFVSKIGLLDSPISETLVPLNGIYLSLDLRYYFQPQKPKK